MKTVLLQAEKREATGKKSAKAVRNEGMVPCVLYGGDETIHFKAAPIAFKPIIYSPDFKTIDLELDGKNYTCILKEAQFHPVTDDLMHVDLLKLVDGHPVRVSLPIRIKGVSPGVKEGGKLQQLMRTVKVKTVPEHLVDELYVDVSTLKLGNSVRVRDIEVPETIEVMTSLATPVASVLTPRALRSAELLDELEPGEIPAVEGEEETAEATEE